MTQREERLGKDLKLGFSEIGADLKITQSGDLDIISDEENLAQAIMCRLSTEKGELLDIGHPEYGSRLHEIVGEIYNELTRRKVKAIVQECLNQETRIREINSIKVSADQFNHHRLNIEITILPVEGSNFLTLLYPFHLEG